MRDLMFLKPSEYKSASIHKVDDRSARSGAGLWAVQPGFAVLPNGPGSGKTEHILRKDKGGKA